MSEDLYAEVQLWLHPLCIQFSSVCHFSLLLLTSVSILNSIFLDGSHSRPQSQTKDLIKSLTTFRISHGMAQNVNKALWRQTTVKNVILLLNCMCPLGWVIGCRLLAKQYFVLCPIYRRSYVWRRRLSRVSAPPQCLWASSTFWRPEQNRTESQEKGEWRTISLRWPMSLLVCSTSKIVWNLAICSQGFKLHCCFSWPNGLQMGDHATV